MGMYLLETGLRLGIRFESARVKEVDVATGHVNGAKLSSGECVDSPIFINTTGPIQKSAEKLVGASLPVQTELIFKLPSKIRSAGWDAMHYSGTTSRHCPGWTMNARHWQKTKRHAGLPKYFQQGCLHAPRVLAWL